MIILQSSNTILKAFGNNGGAGGPRAGADSLVTYIIFGAIVILMVVLAIVNSKKGQGGKQNVAKLAKLHGIDRDQLKILKKAIKDYKINNPEMLFSNSKFLNSTLRRLIREVEATNLPLAAKESIKGEFFEIKRLITTNHVPSGSNLASTKNITLQQEVRLLTKLFPPFNTSVTGKTTDFIVLDHPRDGHGDLINYKEGSLVKIRFIRDPDKVFTFVSSIAALRAIEGEPKILIPHSSKIQRVQLRRNPRRDFNRNAFFYNVKVITEGKGRKTTSRALVDRNRRYSGTFMDISAGGCAIITRNPIPKGNMIMLTFDLEHSDPIEVFGRIRQLQRQRNGTALMHIAYAKVSQRVQNTINTFVYGLMEEDTKHSILNRPLVD